MTVSRRPLGVVRLSRRARQRSVRLPPACAFGQASRDARSVPLSGANRRPRDTARRLRCRRSFRAALCSLRLVARYCAQTYPRFNSTVLRLADIQGKGKCFFNLRLFFSPHTPPIFSSPRRLRIVSQGLRLDCRNRHRLYSCPFPRIGSLRHCVGAWGRERAC